MASLADECAEAIRQMMVRGVGSIGGLAAIGTALAWHHWPASTQREQREEALRRLRTARPTAIDLAHAVDAIDPAIPEGWPGPARGRPRGRLSASRGTRRRRGRQRAPRL